MFYGNLGSSEIFPHFDNTKGYWGVDYPMQTAESWMSLFSLIQSGNQGLYVEVHDPIELQYYPLSYIRIGDVHTPVSHYIDSRAPIMAATGFDDREMLNRILMYRYVISYKPYNFKGHVSDFPLTIAYGQKIDSLRRRYREWIWDLEFRNHLGAAVTAGGHPYELYSVFRNSAGKRAVIVVNQDLTKPITVQVELPKPGRLVAATPEHPDAEPASGILKIPARAVAVLTEQ